MAVASKNRKAVSLLERGLERCSQSRAKREELKEAVMEMGSSVRQAARTDAAWALVPTTSEEFRLIQKRDIVQIMTSLTFREPTFGECYWRIPSSLSSQDCARRLTLLRNALDDGLRRAKGEVVQERVNLKAKKKRSRTDFDDDEEEMDFEFGDSSGSSSSSKSTSSSSSSSSSSLSSSSSSFSKTPITSINTTHKGGQNGSFILRPTSVNVVNLKSCYGMVVCAAKNGNMSADRFKVGAWEIFGFHPQESNKWLIATAHQTNITANGTRLVTKRVSSDEKAALWYIHYRKNVAGENGTQHKYMVISNASTGKYWRADEDGELKCDHPSGTSTECMFYIEESGVGSTNTSYTKAETSLTESSLKKSGGRLVLDDSSDDDSSDDEFAQQLLTSRRAVDDDDDDDDDDDHMVTAAKTKRKRMILSDDDEDSD